ncbi:uncharacterized protein LOC125869766 [Solanum stenotomum]|uniref:uncharacterized protein LOC125869766 n=1 Tax=Solanum stenotomum TaxID=172797 RepID=UPI0020D1C6C5|nr:uncharacterized protein LOC125869766 [Solanum stenotomum]
MSFATIEEARKIMNYYAIASRRGLKIEKVDRSRARYVCQVGCPCKCNISQDKKGASGFSIKNLISEHTCFPCYKNSRADSKTLAQYFKSKLQRDPKYTVKEMREELSTDFDLHVTKSKVKRTKVMILEKLDGSFMDDFNKLEAYGAELKKSNPGTDVEINISKDAFEQGIRKFLRMYICFNALKVGWKSGLRPLIGLDGTFLKDRIKGQVLVAVGQDSMNQFYPIAWAVVDKETTRTWSWFVELLKRSFDLKDGSGVPFISDMQKGLLDAMSNVLPAAHQRFCVRHIESNCLKKWRSGEMKKLMWWCAWSTYDEEFKDQLNRLGKLDADVAKDLISKPPRAWCRAYFDTQCKNTMVFNNFTESFNAWILEARGMPIIKMLEEIRIKVMTRLAENEDKVRHWKTEHSPQCMKLYNDYRAIAHGCTVNFNGDYGYEVSEADDRHTVNLEHIRCTCRLWDLSGIPCPHAINAFMHKKVVPKTQIHWFYSKEAYLLTYKHKMQLVRGIQFWNVDPTHAMEPPDMIKMIGRPTKKRDRTTDEARKRKGEWSSSRKGSIMTCSNCGEQNHNARGCYKAKGAEQISKKGKGKEKIGETSTETQQSSHASRSNSYEPEFGTQPSQQSAFQTQFDTQQSTTYGPDIGDDEDPILRQKTISEADILLAMRKSRMTPSTGGRRIQFTGDATGVSTPTNLPYSPTKITWRGKEVVTSNQLLNDARKKRIKIMARKGQGEPAPDSSEI